MGGGKYIYGANFPSWKLIIGFLQSPLKLPLHLCSTDACLFAQHSAIRQFICQNISFEKYEKKAEIVNLIQQSHHHNKKQHLPLNELYWTSTIVTYMPNLD